MSLRITTHPAKAINEDVSGDLGPSMPPTMLVFTDDEDDADEAEARNIEEEENDVEIVSVELAPTPATRRTTAGSKRSTISRARIPETPAAASAVSVLISGDFCFVKTKMSWP